MQVRKFNNTDIISGRWQTLHYNYIIDNNQYHLLF